MKKFFVSMILVVFTFIFSIINVNASIYLYGDTDFDGQISISDATYIQLYLAQLNDFSDIKKKVADVNADGYVNISDVTEIQQFLTGLTTKFEAGYAYDTDSGWLPGVLS